ncbi:hypothetical protein BLNAU_22674 [Blattamonas nauphoetae]|uniref:Uncharacterized protein n=1 Tax=Blattamonas nauphoetae TaxID=2049346 RepID=A0ABQ9WSD7_9EUKA|nr:hypothetical protein BLNAU_22674 [Blattamonas nauphoetae]
MAPILVEKMLEMSSKRAKSVFRISPLLALSTHQTLPLIIRVRIPSPPNGFQSLAVPTKFDENYTFESNLSSLLEGLQCDDDDIIVDTLRELQKVASEIVDMLFLRYKDLIVATFKRIGNSSPPPVVLTTLARVSIFPHLRMASNSLSALYSGFERDPSAFALIPSPIFPSSSPHQRYSDISFLAALTKKLPLILSDFERNLPTNPSHFPKYVQITKDDPFIITRSLLFCSKASNLPLLLLNENPPIEVDYKIIQDLILFVKEGLTTILTNISTIDSLIASLPSDSSPTTPLVSGVDIQMEDSLTLLRNECEEFVSDGWSFIADVTFDITDPLKSSFQTILLDDPSFPDIVLHSLKLPHKDNRENIALILKNVIIVFPQMKEKFMTANLVGRMFETVDFVSLPLSESQTLFELTNFISDMFEPIGNDDETAFFEQYPLIRVSVFEPAKQFITFMFRSSDKLILNAEENYLLEFYLCWIYRHMKNMELRSDEHGADFVSELVKWEVRTMVEMLNEENFDLVFQSMLNRTSEWLRSKPERQKRREVLLREEGWDDVIELRVAWLTGTDRSVFAEKY